MLKSRINNAVQLDIMQHFLQLLQSMSPSATQTPQGPTSKEEVQKEGMISIDEIALEFIARAQNSLPGEASAAVEDAKDYFLSFYESQAFVLTQSLYHVLQKCHQNRSRQINETQKLLNCLNLFVFNIIPEISLDFGVSTNNFARLMFSLLQDYFKDVENHDRNKEQVQLYARAAAKLANENYISVEECQKLSPLVQAYLEEESLESMAERLLEIILEAQLEANSEELSDFVATSLPLVIKRKQACQLAELVLKDMLLIETSSWQNIVQLQQTVGTMSQAELQDRAASDMLDTNTIILFGLSFLLESVIPKDNESLSVRISQLQTLYEHADNLFRIAIKLHAQNAVEIGKNETVRDKIYYAYDVLKKIESDIVDCKARLDKSEKLSVAAELRKNFNTFCVNYPTEYITRTVQMADYVDRLESHDAACKLLAEAEQRYTQLPKKAPSKVHPLEWAAKLKPIQENLGKKKSIYQKGDDTISALNRLYRLVLEGTTCFEKFLDSDSSETNQSPHKPDDLQKRVKALMLSCSKANITNSVAGLNTFFELSTEAFKVLEDITHSGAAAENKQLITQVAMLMIALSKKLRDLNSGFVVKIMIEMFENLARYCFSFLKSNSTPDATSTPQAQLDESQREMVSAVVEAILKDIAQLPHMAPQSRFAEVVSLHFKKVSGDAILTHSVARLIASAKQDVLDDISIEAIYKLKKDIMLARCLTDNLLPQFHCLAILEADAKDFHCLRNAEFMLRVRTRFEQARDFNETDAELLAEMKQIYSVNLAYQTSFQSKIEAELKAAPEEFNTDKQYAYLGLLGFHSNFLRACCFASDFKAVEASLPTFKQCIADAQKLIEATSQSRRRPLTPNAAKFFENITLDLGWMEATLRAIDKTAGAYIKQNKKVIISHDMEGTVVVSSPPEIVRTLLKKLEGISPSYHLDAFEGLAKFYDAQIRIHNQRVEVLKTYSMYLRSVVAPYHDRLITSFETYSEYMNQLQTNVNVTTFLVTHLARRHDERFPSSKMAATLLELMVDALDTHVVSLLGLLQRQQLPYGSYAQSFEQFKNLFMLFHTHFFQEYQQLIDRASSEQRIALEKFYSNVQLVAQQFSDLELAEIATLSPVNQSKIESTEDDNFAVYRSITSKQDDFSKLLKHFASVAKAKDKLKTSTAVIQGEIDQKTDSLPQFCQSVLNCPRPEDLASNIAFATMIKDRLVHFKALNMKRALPIALAICEQLDRFCNDLAQNLEKMTNKLTALQAEKARKEQQAAARTQATQPKQVTATQTNTPKKTAHTASPEATVPKVVFRDARRQQKSQIEEQQDEYSYERLLEQQLQEDALAQVQPQQTKNSRQEKKAKKEELKKRLELEKQEQAEKAEQLRLEALKRKQEQAEKAKLAEEKKRLAAERKAEEETKNALVAPLADELIGETLEELIAEMGSLALKEAQQAQQEQERKQRYVSSVAALSDLLSSTHISTQQDQHRKMLPDEDFKIRKQLVLPPRVKAVFALFKKANIKAYCYGGFVRDGLLGNSEHKGDFDFVAFCSAEEAKKILGTNCVAHNRYPNQLALEHDVDVSCTTKTLTEFAQKLDLTQNAIFIDENGQAYDPLAVCSTLKGNELNPLGDPMIRFAEDPVKMYRIIRQSNQLNRSISWLGQQALFANVNKLSALSFSDYRREMSKLLLAGNAIPNLRTAFAFNAVAFMFPMFANIDLQNGYIQDWFYSQLGYMDGLAPQSRSEEYSIYMVFAILLAPVVFHEICMIQKLNNDPNLVIDTNEVIRATVNNFYGKFQGYQPSDLEVQALAQHLQSYHRLLNQHHAAYAKELRMYWKQQQQLQQQQNVSPQPQAIAYQYARQQQRGHQHQPQQRHPTSTTIKAVPFKY